MSAEMFTGDVEVFYGDAKSVDYQMWLSGLVAKRAATKRHHLGKDMVNGTRPITQAAYDGIMRNLARCEDLPQVMSCPDQRMPAPGTSSLANPAPAVAVKEKPVAQPAQAPGLTFQDIPAGFYATESATGNNDLDFWKVTIGARSGFRKVKRVVGGGFEQQPKLVEIPKGQQIAALRAIIKAGFDEASALYADKERRCMKCGRQLTDEDSRARRMGLDCWENQGS